MKNEVWKTIEGYPAYEVSNLGQVRRVLAHRGKKPIGILRLNPQNCGYLQVNLYNEGKQRRVTVHSLVAAAFIGKRPEGFEINHIDADKKNNRAENLEYLTTSQNHKHAAENLLGYRGELNGQSKLTADKVKEIKNLSESGLSQRKIAKQFGINQSHVSDIVTGKKWKHLD